MYTLCLCSITLLERYTIRKYDAILLYFFHMHNILLKVIFSLFSIINIIQLFFNCRSTYIISSWCANLVEIMKFIVGFVVKVTFD